VDQGSSASEDFSYQKLKRHKIMLRLIVEIMLLITGAAFIGWLFFIIWLGLKTFFGIALHDDADDDSHKEN